MTAVLPLQEGRMKLLYVEGDAGDSDRMRRALARDAPNITLDIVSTLAEAKARVVDAGATYDLILTDVALPDGSALELIASIRARDLAVAIVALTAAGTAEPAIAALKAGADDYLIKQADYVARVPAALAVALARFRAEAVRRARHEARHVEAIGAFAGGVVHDVNNILSVVAANAELARDDVGPEHPALESLDAIGVAAARGAELVRQLHAFSRRELPNPAVASLRPLIEETATMLEGSLPAGVELAVRVDAAAPTVLADSTQLRRLLMNLGTNASDALAGRSGRIAIELDAVAIDATMAPMRSLRRSGQYARITVSDTGRGMTAATLERIFDPFFTTKDVGKGTGLGLAVVRGIVLAHGGTITVDSRPGEGATFRVYLPAADDADSAGSVDRENPDAAGHVAG